MHEASGNTGSISICAVDCLAVVVSSRLHRVSNAQHLWRSPHRPLIPSTRHHTLTPQRCQLCAAPRQANTTAGPTTAADPYTPHCLQMPGPGPRAAAPLSALAAIPWLRATRLCSPLLWTLSWLRSGARRCRGSRRGPGGWGGGAAGTELGAEGMRGQSAGAGCRSGCCAAIPMMP
jgi:hypothetical protein